MSKAFSDKEIIDAISAGGRQLDKVLDYIYHRSQYRDSIINLVMRWSGSREDAEDVFQEGICRLVQNIRKGQFEGRSSLRTYLTTICKNLWSTRFAKVKRDTAREQSWKPDNDYEASPDQIVINEERSQLIKSVLEQLGEKCKQVLGLWALDYRMKEIAREAGYKSAGMARRKKYECRKKLTALLKDQPDLITDLKDLL